MAQEVPDSEVGGDTNLSKIEIPLNQVYGTLTE